MFSAKLQCRSIAVFLFLVTNSAVARRFPTDLVNESKGVRGARRQEENEFRKHDNNMGGCMGGNTCAPSSVPTSAPSVSPTDIPSSTPSHTPSEIPTESPTESQAPTTSPSSVPSSKPSPSPSYAPSSTPSLSLQPSSSPSFAPTVTKTMEGTDSEGFATSSCIAQTPILTSSSKERSRLEFVYHLILSDEVNLAEAEKVTTSIEPRLNSALGKEAMACDWEESFALVGLSAADKDTVDGNCAANGVVETGTSCWVVNGKMTATIFYPYRRRLTSGEVLPQLIAWLEAVLPRLASEDEQILGLKLQGFSEIYLPYTLLGDGKSPEDAAGTAQLNIGNFPQGEPTTSAWALTMIAVAGTVLTVLLVAAVVRRRGRRDAYLKHLAQVNDLDLDPQLKEEMDVRGVLVNDMDLNSIGEAYQTIELEDANHDYRACASPSCELCQQRTGPIFILSDMDSMQAEAVQDLRGKKYSPGNRKHVNDTQVL